jgi:hypothetical protein
VGSAAIGGGVGFGGGTGSSLLPAQATSRAAKIPISMVGKRVKYRSEFGVMGIP